MYLKFRVFAVMFLFASAALADISGMTAIKNISKISFGNEGSGGGSASAAEFTELGYNAAKAIAGLASFPVNDQAFKAAVASTHVEFVEEILQTPAGLEVDALNFPQKGLIRVNIAHWQKLFLAPVLKYQLAVHEYLGILKIDDTGYKTSRLILDGGVKLTNLACNFPIGDATKGILSWYTLDVSGNGSSNTAVAQFAVQSVNQVGDAGDGVLNMQSPVTMGVSIRNGKQGYILSWTAILVEETAFISLAELTTAGAFSEPYFGHTGMDPVTGLPSYAKVGVLSCSLQRN